MTDAGVTLEVTLADGIVANDSFAHRRWVRDRIHRIRHGRMVEAAELAGLINALGIAGVRPRTAAGVLTITSTHAFETVDVEL